MEINRYVGLADSELVNLFGDMEGDVGDKEVANRTLRYFYKEAINMKFFLKSAGREGEYKSFMDRFRKKFPNAEKVIQRNLELEEIEVKEGELEGAI